MELETKILSRALQQYLYDNDKTIGTAESCTGGRIAEAIIATPGSSKYFKGGVIAYTNEVKENILGVSEETLAEEDPVSEAVAKEMVIGACKSLNVDFAISSTGYAGPSGNGDIPVGTIWLACGNTEEQLTLKLTEDFGRDVNLAIATNSALRLFISLIKEELNK
ncbi:MAG: CinA family protein [Prevotellaceae bacterium]|nr:CinA family protein [Prevotellaceae bacterium]MDY3365369.1 CinA family protein [Prevotella sp.]